MPSVSCWRTATAHLNGSMASARAPGNASPRRAAGPLVDADANDSDYGLFSKQRRMMTTGNPHPAHFRPVREFPEMSVSSKIALNQYHKHIFPFQRQKFFRTPKSRRAGEGGPTTRSKVVSIGAWSADVPGVTARSEMRGQEDGTDDSLGHRQIERSAQAMPLAATIRELAKSPSNKFLRRSCIDPGR